MRTRLLSALALLAGAPLALGQQQAPAYFVVHQEVAKPTMVAQYEATSKEFVALVKAHKDKMPHFRFNAYVSPDFTYTYVVAMPNIATMDAINAEFGALAQAAGASFMDINRRGGAATDHVRESIVALAPELSYRPAQPRLKPEEIRYVHYDFYYVLPGREPDADALSADYLKLFRDKGIANGYNVYKTVMGPEMPLYVVAIGAKDAGDFHAENAKTQAQLGAEGQTLAGRAMGLTRRFDQRSAVPRPDLSVLP